jgi:hypothetical protein
LFTLRFGDLLAFVYHCFDRIVIYGYLSGLSRPAQVVHFFRNVVGVATVSKEVLSQRTADYQAWVEAYARNHRLPIEWAEKGVRKEDHVLPWQRRIAKQDAYGVYFIFKSMEQGATFRVSVPKYATKDPNYRILAPQRSRFTHYYFYIRDAVLGPMVMRVASFFPFQTSYYLNGHSFIEQELRQAQIGFRKIDNAFLAVDDVAALQAAADRLSPDIIRKRLDYWTLVLGPKFSAKERGQSICHAFMRSPRSSIVATSIFKRHFPIHKLLERSCELGLWRLTADKIAEIFGTRVHRRMHGKLATVIDRIDHGHHVFRAYNGGHTKVFPVQFRELAVKPIFDSALRQVIERTRQSTPRRRRGTTRLVLAIICPITGDRATPAAGDTRLAATRRANRSMTHCRFASPRTWLVLRAEDGDRLGHA